MFQRIKQAFSRAHGHVKSRLSMSGDSFMYVLLCILVILGPIFFIPVVGFSVVMSKGFLIFFVGILSLLIYGVQVLRRGIISLPRHKLFIVLALISGVGIIGSILSPSFGASFFGYGFETTTWLFMTVFGFLIFFSYRTIQSYERVGILYAGLTGAFVLLVILHVVRYIGGPAVANLGVLGGNTDTLIGSWSDLGIFFGLIALFSTITLELAGLKRSFKWVVGIIGGIALVFLAFMNISTVWIVLGLVALLFALYSFSFAYWDREEKKYRKDSRVPGYALALFVISVVCIFFGGLFSNWADKHQNISWSDVRPSVTTTLRVAGKSLAHNFATGYGPNMFAPGWSYVKPPALSGSNASNTDFSLGFGYVPTHIATEGILGAILWIGFFVLLGMALVKRMGRGFDTSIDRYFTISLGVLIIYLSIIAWVYIPGNYLIALFAVLIGVFLSVAPSDRPLPDISFSFIKDPRASFFGILTITVLIVATLFGGYVGTRKLISFVHYVTGQYLLVKNDLQGANREITVASNLASHDIYHGALANFALSDANRIVGSATSANKDSISQQTEQVLGVALGHAKAAVAMNRTSYKNWIMLGNVYRFMVAFGIEGSYDQAVAAYKEAQTRNPNDTTMTLYFAQLDLAKGDTKSALALIADSINKYPTKDAYVLRAQIQINQKEYKSAIVSMSAAVSLDPYNLDLVYQYGLLLFTQKEYTNAIVAFQRAVLINKNYGPAYIYLGISYERSGDIESANKVYEYLRKQAPDADEAINQVKNGSVETPAPTTETTDSPTPLKPAASKS